jgi:hypothetical protein
MQGLREFNSPQGVVPVGHCHRAVALAAAAALVAHQLVGNPGRMPASSSQVAKASPARRRPAANKHAHGLAPRAGQGGGGGGFSAAAWVARLRCSRRRSRAEPLVACISTASTPAARPHGGMLR